MIEAYQTGEAVPIHLPEDKENPTVFHVEPVNDQTSARWRALQEWVASKEKERHDEDTAEAVIAAADASSEKRRALLAARIPKVENAPPDGETIQGQEAVAGLLSRMTAVPLAQLVGVMQGAVRLADLTFRADPKSGAGELPAEGTEEKQT
jgi:hypothetical protein